MDDLEDLQARVAAAQEKLRLNADDQRKYGLRLNDVVTIVEGSLARQQTEMKRLQDAAVALRLESDAARVAENQAKSLYEAALARLQQLQAQSEQLRNMVLTLLNVIEGREAPSALQAVVQRLEGTVQENTATRLSAVPAQSEPKTDALNEAAMAEEAPANEMPAEEIAADSSAEAETAAFIDHEEIEELAAEDVPVAQEVAGEADEAMPEFNAASDDATLAEMSATAGPIEATASSADNHAEDMIAATEEDIEAGGEIEAESSDIAADAEDMPEDIGTLSMNGHRDFVTDADEIVANEALVDAVVTPEFAPVSESMVDVKPRPITQQAAAQLAHEDEILVSALLDAEKALIEAGASGVANANSPVAEIIRRISLRTREFSEASGV